MSIRRFWTYTALGILAIGALGSGIGWAMAQLGLPGVLLAAPVSLLIGTALGIQLMEVLMRRLGYPLERGWYANGLRLLADDLRGRNR